LEQEPPGALNISPNGKSFPMRGCSTSAISLLEVDEEENKK